MISETLIDTPTPNIAKLSDLRTHHTRTIASLENKLDAIQSVISNLTSRRSRYSSRGSKNREPQEQTNMRIIPVGTIESLATKLGSVLRPSNFSSHFPLQNVSTR